MTSVTPAAPTTPTVEPAKVVPSSSQSRPRSPTQSRFTQSFKDPRPPTRFVQGVGLPATPLSWS